MSTSHAPCLPSDGFSQWNGRVWRLAGPIILANISTPLLGAVDTAVMGHLPDPAYIGGVAIGAVIFDFLFWGFGFLQMSTSGFTSQAQGAGDQVGGARDADPRHGPRRRARPPPRPSATPHRLL